MSTTLTGELVSLRALEPEDLEWLYKWENDTAQWAVSDISAPYSRHVLWQYLETYTGDIYQTHQLRLMVVERSTGKPIGTADLINFSPLDRRAELGLLIDRQHRGQGYGREALQLLCTYCRDHLGLRQCYVVVREDNAVALDTFKGCKFETCGRLRKWVYRNGDYHDAVLLQRLFS